VPYPGENPRECQKIEAPAPPSCYTNYTNGWLCGPVRPYHQIHEPWISWVAIHALEAEAWRGNKYAQ
jgi:hypothetical protein